MSVLSTIKALLDADATLNAVATGDIWDFDATGRLGINRTTTPTAFDSTGIIKPCILLRMRSSTPDFILRDDTGQYNSVREIVECWIYQDNGYANIDTMRNRIYTLLHAQQVSGAFQLFWAGDVRGQRDWELDANVDRSDYLAVVLRRG